MMIMIIILTLLGILQLDTFSLLFYPEEEGAATAKAPPTATGRPRRWLPLIISYRHVHIFISTYSYIFNIFQHFQIFQQISTFSTFSSLFINKFVCLYLALFSNVFIYTRLTKDMHTYMYIYIYIYIYICIYIYTCMYVCMYIYIYIHVYTYTYLCIIHIYIYIHIHTHSI